MKNSKVPEQYQAKISDFVKMQNDKAKIATKENDMSIRNILNTVLTQMKEPPND